MALAAFNFDSNETKAYFAIAVGILGLAYLWLRPMLKKKRGDPLEKAPFSGLSKQRAVEREMQNLLVELAEMSRQITAQLDTRAEKLNLLIAEADQKIAELKRLSRARAMSVEGAARPGELAASRSGEVDKSSADPHLDAPTAPIGLEGHSTDEIDPRHAEVYDLADSGLDASEIARRQLRPRGEIELILALRPKEAAQST